MSEGIYRYEENDKWSRKFLLLVMMSFIKYLGEYGKWGFRRFSFWEK